MNRKFLNNLKKSIDATKVETDKDGYQTAFYNDRGSKFDISKLKDGDGLGVGSRVFDVFATSIQKLTKSLWHHIGTLIQDTEYISDEGFVKVWYVYEAKFWKGYCKTPLVEYLNRFEKNKVYLTVVRIRPSAFKSKHEVTKRRKIACERAREMVGLAYDRSAIAGMFFISIIKNTGRKTLPKNNWFNSKNKVICSESFCAQYHDEKDKVSVFVGDNDKVATCSTISPKDVIKSKNVFKVTGDMDIE